MERNFIDRELEEANESIRKLQKSRMLNVGIAGTASLVFIAQIPGMIDLAKSLIEDGETDLLRTSIASMLTIITIQCWRRVRRTNEDIKIMNNQLQHVLENQQEYLIEQQYFDRFKSPN